MAWMVQDVINLVDIVISSVPSIIYACLCSISFQISNCDVCQG